MSIFRVMMFLYIIRNFERIVYSFIFFLFFSYFFSYAAVLYHDGIASFAMYKNPVVLYRRVFHIVKWYYYNRDALTTGRIAILSLLGVGTLFTQGAICRIPFQRIFVHLCGLIFSRHRGLFSRGKKAGEVIPVGIEVEKEKFLLNIEKIAEGIIYDFLKLQRSPSGITVAGVTRIKEVSVMRIGYEIEDLISGILVRQEVNHEEEEDRFE